MLTKKALLGFLVIFSLSSIADCSANSIGKSLNATFYLLDSAINNFGIGYGASVWPIHWRYIPRIINGDATCSRYRSPAENIIAYVSASVGLLAGISVLGLAVYGLKKILEKKKVTDPKENNAQLI